MIKLGAERDGFAAFMRIYAPSAHAWFPLVSPGITTLLSRQRSFLLLLVPKKLYSDFHTRAARALAPVRMPLPPPLPGEGTPRVATSS